MNQEIQTSQEIQQQAGKLLSQVAGYVGVKTMDIGLRFGLFEEIAKHPQGISAETLANQKGLDTLYTNVWCRSAYASEILDMKEDQVYLLAPHMDKLFLDQNFPGYIGGLPGVIAHPEMFDQFSENISSGDRIWWDRCSPSFIQGVSQTGRPFYTRLIPGGLSQISSLSELLEKGCHILELACGTGTGLMRMAQTYPKCSFAGLDGDAYSLEVAANNLQQKGFKNKISLMHSMMEEMNDNDRYDMVFINVSMHECRDIKKVITNVYNSLKKDGYFVVSDFPFPESTEGCRTVPSRIMCGIQFFEALIGDQLLPTRTYVELLNKHDFRNVGTFDIAPVHAVTFGQK